MFKENKNYTESELLQALQGKFIRVRSAFQRTR
jgi:hypothetical protein